MPLYSLDEIKAKIEALDLKIAKAEDTQATTSGGPGQGQHTQRGDLGAMYRERERLSKEYERLEALVSHGNTNLAQFVRPS
jgi:hypothetical protein